MGQINVTTNLPAAIVRVYHGGDSSYVEKRFSPNPIPCLSIENSNTFVETSETISIENLKNGIYQVRIMLPYFNGNIEELGSYFTMPVLMDYTCAIHDERSPVENIVFKASLTNE